uniref:Uncharacterized protein n=1 Tax=Podoviridae sp. ctZkC8 TaxID=2825259 RepID=A0A8S5UC46_9CAUD|nr:MAG TPA: hypothetical protein [Podoviridae sp. ctZkC8]
MRLKRIVSSKRNTLSNRRSRIDSSSRVFRMILTT